MAAAVTAAAAAAAMAAADAAAAAAALPARCLMDRWPPDTTARIIRWPTVAVVPAPAAACTAHVPAWVGARHAPEANRPTPAARAIAAAPPSFATHHTRTIARGREGVHGAPGCGRGVACGGGCRAPLRAYTASHRTYADPCAPAPVTAAKPYCWHAPGGAHAALPK